jgi:hypothetical protein
MKLPRTPFSGSKDIIGKLASLGFNHLEERIMNTAREFTDGELLAYIDGVSNPALEQALEESASLRLRLDDLRSIDSYLHKTMAGSQLEDNQDLVDVAAGQATPAQKLLVSARLRANPKLKALFEELKQQFSTETKGRAGRTLPVFLGVLVQAAGVRSGAPLSEQSGKSYEIRQVDARVQLNIAQQAGERWRLTGRLTRQGQPTSALISLRRGRGRGRDRQSDLAGFFEFSEIPSGSYRVRITLDDAILEIPEILLDEE